MKEVFPHIHLSDLRWKTAGRRGLTVGVRKKKTLSVAQLVACLRKYFSASLDMWCSDFIVHKPHTCVHTHMLHICARTQTLSELLVA